MCKRFPEPDKIEGKNCLATIVERFFNPARLRCFHDQKSIAIGKRTGEVMRKSRRQSFALVQLIEEESLNPPDEPPNWCQVEWEEFSGNGIRKRLLADRAGDVRMFFVAEPDLLAPVEPHPPDESNGADTSPRSRPRSSHRVPERSKVDMGQARPDT